MMDGSAVSRIADLAQEAMSPLEVDGETYIPQQYTHLTTPFYVPEEIEVASLTSIVEYIDELSEHELEARLIVQVRDATTVLVMTESVGEKSIRAHLIRADAVLPNIILNRFMDHERFIIQLRSQFREEPDQVDLLKFVSRVNFTAERVITDNGATQTANVRTVIEGELVESREVPSRIHLTPFRTFQEVQQPTSEFIFRLQENGDCALFEADGGLWQSTARAEIAAWLKAKIERTGVHVLS